MGAPAEMAFTSGVVNPGHVVDITVPLVAPSTPGTYQGFFKLKSSDGKVFGLGNTADKPFWVKIKVKSVATDTPSPTAKADLVVTHVEFAPYPPQAHVPVMVRVTIKNDGDVLADDFKVYWYAINTALAPACIWNNVNTILPGDKKILTCNYTYLTSGSNITTLSVVDVDNSVVESSEGNNSFTKTISVVP